MQNQTYYLDSIYPKTFIDRIRNLGLHIQIYIFQIN